MFHCGAGAKDSKNRSGLLRYHLYFVPKSAEVLVDGVHLLENFNPPFEKWTTSESDWDSEVRNEESRARTLSVKGRDVVGEEEFEAEDEEEAEEKTEKEAENRKGSRKGRGSWSHSERERGRSR